MAYEQKDGQFSLFKNKYHEKGDNKPVMRGTGMWRGEIIEFAVWSKQDRDGNPFFSGKMQEPREQKADHQNEQPAARVMPKRADMDDDIIPF